MGSEQSEALTAMDLGRYYMRRVAMQVDSDHFQELCRMVAYAIDPAQTAYDIARQYGVSDLMTPADIFQVGQVPELR